MRGVMDVCIRQAANRLLAEMMQPTADASGKKLYPARGKYSTSCDDVPATWTQVASS